MKKLIVLITLFVVVVGLTSITGCLDDIDDLEFSIPSDYIKESTAIFEGFELTQYIVDDKTTSEILDELKKSAEDAGWKTYAEDFDLGPYLGGIAYEKNDELLIIYVSELEEQTMTFIMTGSKEHLNDEKPPTNDLDEAPKTDVDGEDLNEIPRYTDSVRTAYWHWMSTDISTHYVTYITEDTKSEVKDYYENILSDWNDYVTWQYQQDGETVIWLSAEKQEIYTLILIGPSDFEGYTEIYITYTIE
ncbi:hypothetical protein [Methanonatronarchaeum sp. AMET-Sl]|uniref:hypothetical protein n=1 Tax=Methanonatronarchaeum sp. AMET-Sl TaxID=3037654 RepID=UPI00244DA872|nr:hypothetical protein [Methanonatronarchaeum sp. AMET-Sl]WGI17997.1 hypothetical protein QEN48_03050 [Methanonatronarchaeum sp. AMET-Sl]